MIGRGRTGDARNVALRRRRRLLSLGILLGLVGAILGVFSGEAGAQAGRRRQPPPPPRGEEKKAPATEGAPPASPTVKKGAEIAEELHLPERATTRVRLRNGLRLIVRERYRSPLVGLVVVVRAGRSEEPQGQAGIARLVGRALLRGAWPQSHEEMDALGGELSVEERAGCTIFRMTLAAEQTRQALQVLADRLQHPLFDEAALRQEIEQILLEERLWRDQPDVFARERALAFALEGRELPSFSEREKMLRALGRQAVLDFYQRHYRAEEIVIALVGAIATPEVLEHAQRLFGDFEYAEKPAPDVEPSGEQKPHESTPAPKKEEAPAAPAPGFRYAQDRGNIATALVTVLHEVPQALLSHQSEWPLALRLLAIALAEGRASRGALGVREDRRIAALVEAEPVIRRDRGALLVQWRVDPADAERVLRAYLEEAAALRRLRLSPGEWQRIRALAELQWLRHRATYVGEAEQLALEEALSGDFRRADDFLRRLEGMTPEALRAFAEQCLHIEQMAIHEYLPRSIARPPDAAGLRARLGAQVPGILEREVPNERLADAPEVPLMPQGVRRESEGEGADVLFSLQPEPVRDFSVLEGPRAFVREDRSRPLLSVGLFFQGGRSTEASPGLTELMLRSLLKGARERDRAEASRGGASLSARETFLRLEQMGAELVTINEPDFFGYVLTVLSRNQEPALRLLLDLVERPALTDEEIRLEQARLLLEIRARREDPVRRSRDLAARALYGDTPYGRAPVGEEDSVRALTPERVRAWYAQTIAQQLPLVLIVGDTDGSALVSGVISREIRRENLQHVFYATLPKPSPEARALSEEVGAHAVVQTFASLGPASPSEDEPALSVLRAHLVGWGSALRREISSIPAALEDVSLEFRRMGGMLALTILTAPEGAGRARQIVEQEWGRLSQTPLDAERVTRAIRRALLEHKVLLEDHRTLALAYARAFFSSARPQQVEQQEQRIRAVTAADVQRAAATYAQASRLALGVARVRPQGGTP